MYLLNKFKLGELVLSALWLRCLELELRVLIRAQEFSTRRNTLLRYTDITGSKKSFFWNIACIVYADASSNIFKYWTNLIKSVKFVSKSANTGSAVKTVIKLRSLTNDTCLWMDRSVLNYVRTATWKVRNG